MSKLVISTKNTGTKLAPIIRKVHTITITPSSTFTFADVDFIVYCQKALFSNDIWRIRIEDWEPGYCIAYLKTMRQYFRWKPLTFKYRERGHYIYVCRTNTRTPASEQRHYRKAQRNRKNKLTKK